MTFRYVYGDLLEMTHVDAICHQVNCLTVKSHGLSRLIAEKYPWADIYSFRTQLGRRNLATLDTRGVPGTIKVFERMSNPSVVCFLSQWDYGKCGQAKRLIHPYKDTEDNRTLWFEQCLHELGQTHFNTIAFPFKIGCGLAGGHWNTYCKLIMNFANTYQKHVIIVMPVT